PPYCGKYRIYLEFRGVLFRGSIGRFDVNLSATIRNVRFQAILKISWKCLRMSGWDAGIRTPIRRSRVPWRANRLNQINNLVRQIPENHGKIRNAAAMEANSILTNIRPLDWLFRAHLEEPSPREKGKGHARALWV